MNPLLPCDHGVATHSYIMHDTGRGTLCKNASGGRCVEVNEDRPVLEVCAAAAAVLLTPPPPVMTDRRAAAADCMTASRVS